MGQKKTDRKPYNLKLAGRTGCCRHKGSSSMCFNVGWLGQWPLDPARWRLPGQKEALRAGLSCAFVGLGD